MGLRRAKGFFLALVLVFLAAAPRPAWCEAAATAPLTAAQIVDRMQQRNQQRTSAMTAMKSRRVYQVEYQGFSRTIAAKMEAEFTQDPASGKSFRILSQSGSRMLCEKVLRRAMESEKEASQDKSGTALTAANYRFQLLGSESLDGRPAFLLDVEPVTPSKFLYKGRIWVDAADFALVKIDAEPAKNPSFWITRTRILQTFAKTGDLWLPRSNRSETKVRVGGSAFFSIDYGNYQMEAKAALAF